MENSTPIFFFVLLVDYIISIKFKLDKKPASEILRVEVKISTMNLVYNLGDKYL